LAIFTVGLNNNNNNVAKCGNNSKNLGEWNLKQYIIWFQFWSDISSDIWQNPVPVGFQKMPSMHPYAQLTGPSLTRNTSTEHVS